MTKITPLLCAALCSVLFFAQTSQAAKLALVLGNDKYRNVAELKNAGADAKSMSTALERVGYQVNFKKDLDEKAMKAALRDFKEKVSGGDEVVIFYSGHGMQLAGSNYLLPVDIKGENEGQVKDEAIPLQRILEDMQEQKAKFTLAVIDACRDNPFKTQGRAIGGKRPDGDLFGRQQPAGPRSPAERQRTADERGVHPCFFGGDEDTGHADRPGIEEREGEGGEPCQVGAARADPCPLRPGSRRVLFLFGNSRRGCRAAYPAGRASRSGSGGGFLGKPEGKP